MNAIQLGAIDVRRIKRLLSENNLLGIKFAIEVPIYIGGDKETVLPITK